MISNDFCVCKKKKLQTQSSENFYQEVRICQVKYTLKGLHRTRILVLLCVVTHDELARELSL